MEPYMHYMNVYDYSLDEMDDNYLFIFNSDKVLYIDEETNKLTEAEDIKKMERKMKKIRKNTKLPIRCIEAVPQTVEYMEEIKNDTDPVKNRKIRNVLNELIRTIPDKKVILAVWHHGNIASIYYK